MTDIDLALPPFDDADRPQRVEPDEDGIERDRWGRYVIPHPESGVSMGWTRATTFAKTISDTFTLDMWGRRMTMKGLTLRQDILAMVAATPLEEKDKLNGLAKQAADAAAARAGSNLGSALHAFTEQVDRGEDVLIPPPWDADVAAYRAILRQAGLRVLPEYIERIICEIRFKVGGKFDRIVATTQELSVQTGSKVLRLQPDERVIFDLKTGRNLQYGWGEIAVQLALYAHAHSIWDKDAKRHEQMPAVRQDIGLVLHLPAGAATATLYAVDLTEGWAAAELCHRVRGWRNARNLAAPLVLADPPRPISTPPTRPGAAPLVVRQPAPTVREPTWAERIDKATSREELSAIWRQASAKGQWTPALLERGRRKASELEL